MRPFIPRPSLLVGALGLAAAGLCALIYWEWTVPPESSVPHGPLTSHVSPEISPETIEAPTPPPRQSLSDFLTRPLFTATRRPAPLVAAAAAPEPAAAPTLPKFTLLGTVAAADWRGAILKTPAGKVLDLVEGDKVDGWLLSGVFPDRLIFDSGKSKEELTFPAPKTTTKGPSVSAVTDLSETLLSRGKGFPVAP